MCLKDGRPVAVCSVLFAFVLQTQAGIQANAPARIDPSAVALQAALDRGGLIQFNTNGTIALSANLNVTEDAIVDASDRTIVIDGGGKTRLFHAHTNVNLALRHLILTNGLDSPFAGSPSSHGGAIFNDGSALEIVDCQFTHNKAFGASTHGYAYGGDVFNNTGHVRITNCSFQASSAVGYGFDMVLGIWAFGGSIYSMGGDVTIDSATFDSCSVSAGYNPTVGGAVASFGAQLRVLNSRFLNNGCASFPIQGNTAISNPIGPIGQGGAIYNGGIYTYNSKGDPILYHGGTLTIEHCQFVTNLIAGTVAQGAAIYNDPGSTLTCSDSYFGHHNVVRPYSKFFRDNQLGGAIYNGGIASFLGSVFEDNSAQGLATFNSVFYTGSQYAATSAYGGAIYSSNVLTVGNCTFYQNQASGGASTSYDRLSPPPSAAGAGGAIYVSHGSADIQFSTFFENQVTGSLNTWYTNTAPAKPVTTSGPALGAALASGTNAGVTIRGNIFANLQPTTNFNQLSGAISDLGFNLSSDASPQLTLASSLRNTDPKLGSYGIYGGVTPIFPLLPGSPAIDAGPTNDIPLFDQRGAPRLVGKATDIGSYEVLANGKMVLIGASPWFNLFFPFDTNRNWTVQVSTNLAVWETFNGANTDQPGFIGATIDNPSGTLFFRAVGK